MTTLMRNGRDRRSENPFGPREERTRLVDWDRSADHIRASGHSGRIARRQASKRKQAVYMAAPERFAESQILFPCTAGAVHTWLTAAPIGRLGLRQRGKKGDSRWEDEAAYVRSRTAGVMTTLMRNGRDRRSENPQLGQAILERVQVVGTDQRITSGPAATAAASHGGAPPSENRPYTWLHPNASQKVRFFSLAPRAPSIHGTIRKAAAATTRSRSIPAA